MISGLFKRAIARTLGTSIVFDYDDPSDFSALWNRESDGSPDILNRVAKAEAIVIVWEGFSQANFDRSERLLQRHLTPLDWALAFSYAAIKKREERPDIRVHPELQIHVIDLTGNKFADAWSIRMRHQLLAEMPWVTLHAPLLPEGERPPGRAAYEPVLIAPTGKAQTCEQLPDSTIPASSAPDRPLLVMKDGAWTLGRPGKSFAASAGERQKRRLADLAEQWTASLSRSDYHHDVNNIIGADILANPEQRRPGLFGAFLTRLQWSGRDLKISSSWSQWDAASHVRADLFNRKISAYVVDDNLAQGWDRFLCRLLGGQQFDRRRSLASEFVKLNTDSQTIDLFGSPTPKPLIEFLRESGVFNQRNYASQLSDGRPVPELILLDLRLYATVDEAREDAKQLLDILKIVRGSLAWRPIDAAEAARIRNWSIGSNDDPRAPDEALLLLPRLLALALPLTPIILFSSTGQAWIKERLKPYRNIFTGFEKPRVLSDPHSIEESLSAIRDGLNTAVTMMRLRLQMAHAQAAYKIAEGQRPPRQQRLSTHHIEIYADETQTLEQGIASGLAVCVFPDSNAAERLQAHLWREHNRIGGVVWTKLPNGPPSQLKKGSAIRRDLTECQAQCTSLATLLGGVPLTEIDRLLWTVVATRMPPHRTAATGAVSVAAFPDAPLDEALRFNLEFALHGLIPYYTKGADGEFNGTVQIHLPTRVVPAGNYDVANSLCVAFDLGLCLPDEVNPNSWKAPTANLLLLENDSALGTAFPLVRAWLHEWRRSATAAIIGQITKVKMTKITQGLNGISSELAHNRRLFHDIADWICAASVDVGSGILKRELIATKLFPRWFHSTDNEEISGEGARYYERDGANALMLMRAVKALFLSDDRAINGRDSTDHGGSDALRLMLRNSYVQRCSMRLLDHEHCAQQRIILWMLRREIDYATGSGLHDLLVSDLTSARRRGSKSSKDSAKSAREVTQAAEDVPTARSSASEAGFERRRLSLPEVFDDALRFGQFPDAKVYQVVHQSRQGSIFVTPEGVPVTRGSHWDYNPTAHYELKGEGWSDPITVLATEPPPIIDPMVAIYVAETERAETRVRIVAAKLADGRWRSLLTPSSDNL